MNMMLLRRTPTPRPGRFVQYRPDVDSGEGRVPDDLNFVAIKALLDAADDGDAEAMLSLNDTMEARDLRLRSVANTRRSALTVMEWGIDPADAVSEESQRLAKIGAEYIGETLSDIPSFDLTLKGLSKAIGPNLAVSEVVWGAGEKAGEVVGFEVIKYQRLVIQRQLTEDVRIITSTAPDGEVPPAYKFIVHAPEAGNYIFTNTITRAQAPLWVMKKLAQMDWTTFCEIFGMPVRIGTYSPQATKQQKDEALRALKTMGATAYAMLSDSIKYEMMEAQRGTEPYSTLIEWIEKAQAIGYLGQNLSTDSTGSGGLGGAGAAQVHNEVRRLLTEEDAAAEERTLRTTLFPWMLRFRFPQNWQRMPIPRFRRIYRDGTPRIDKAAVIEAASQRLGLPVSKEWAYRELAIPMPSDGEETIERIEQVLPPSPFGG